MRALARTALAVGLLVGVPSGARGQGAREIGLHGLATAGRTTVAVVGPSVGIRPLERLRLQASAGVGVSGGAVAGRGEALAHFLLQPSARTGLGWYAGGGLALARAGATEGYVVLLLGVEASPGARAGWGLEVGVGGGVRVAAFHRWRRHRLGR